MTLASPAAELPDELPTVVVGSGYGGAVTAARLAEAGRPVALLERGKEWPIGSFPDTGKELRQSLRKKKNPLGLFELYLCRDIDVLKGCGLGGGSLINASVAIRPDREAFEDPRWPAAVRRLAASGELWRYYERAEGMLAAGHHPRALELTKVQRVAQRAGELTGAEFGPMPIAVNFTVDGENAAGVAQKPCIDCGDCITGCNVSAKNTLYMNYLPYAKTRGARIFTGVEVRHVEPAPGGGWTVHFRRNDENGHGPGETLRAKNVILAGGTLGSTEILLRSAAHGLGVSPRLGEGFSGNGDFLGLAYNGDFRTDVMGFGNRPESPRAAVRPGPTIVSGIRYDRSKPFGARTLVQDFTTFPSGLVNTFRRTLPVLALTGMDTDSGARDRAEELGRIGRDLVKWDPDGAVNHSMVYLVMAIDDGGGRMRLDEQDKLRIEWPSLRNDPIFKEIGDEVLAHARTLGATYVHLDRWNPWTGMGNLVTAHPLGGCGLGDDADSGVVDDGGRVFDGAGGTHPGLHVADGAIVPMPLAVNPLLTISALAERIAEGLPRNLAE